MSRHTNYEPQFIIIPYNVFSSEQITSSDKLLYWTINYFAKMELWKCIASNETLMNFSPFKTERSVQKSLEKLETNKFILKHFIGDDPKNGREMIECMVEDSPTRTT